ncbi:MAG: right-handed parallel beta-helix repeat-containing protein [Bacteroidales bacterium]|nr:right-handed parallel beta-helix repeat-containing protein [Bacteroidales bacterium]
MKLFSLFLLSFALTNPLFCTNYYVDYDLGNDTNTGATQNQAWKHCPGDENAKNVPASVVLQPGDIIYFKGGTIYQGNITLNYSGDSLNHITYKGDGWGSEKAIIDGSAPINGWTAFNDSIYYADIPAEFTLGENSSALNLHEFNYSTNEDEYMYTSQTPNPADWYFNDDHIGFIPVANHNLTRTSITDSAIFNQTDSTYWDNSSLLIWTNPNRVVMVPITHFFPELRTVYFDSLREEAIYPDGRDQGYAIYNSMHALDQPGEYYVNFEEGKIYIFPKFVENLNTSISISVREFGFDISNKSGITIEGFTIRKHSGNNLISGIGIGCFTSASTQKNYITIRNNYITHNCHSERGYGGIYISNISNSIIENNEVVDNFRHRGIFCSGGTNVIVQNNTISRSGQTSLTFYTMTYSRILYNTIIESLGGHANGITVYIASKDILIAGNKVIECASPMTFQDCGNLYFVNNLIDSKYYDYGVNEWVRTSRGPWTFGEIVFLNNTILSVPGQPAFNIEKSRDTIYTESDTIYENTYVSYNNIIDAGGGNHNTDRGYNLYTSLAWNQEARYDWYLAEGEIVEEERDVVFQNPSESIFNLAEGSPAINAGTDVSQFLPTYKFPDFNFNMDINKYPRPAQENWSIGAYEYGSPVSSPEIGPTHLTLHILVYPNPFKEIIYIGIDKNVRTRVYSVNGILLFETTEKEIKCADLPKGVYFVNIIGEQGMYSIEKIVKY